MLSIKSIYNEYTCITALLPQTNLATVYTEFFGIDIDDETAALIVYGMKLFFLSLFAVMIRWESHVRIRFRKRAEPVLLMNVLPS